ncbi:MAG: proteasome assembly chaperone family protein [Candidatus Altiarchaeota archaeon]|nr:proteasome assembly chaperone family protein [Candidatus Altiarchaeota archaeon]
MGIEALKGKTVITGFHGIGFVGFISIDFMVRKLNTSRVDWYFNHELPAVIFAGKDKLEMPVEFHSKGDLGFMKISIMAERDILNHVIEDNIKAMKGAGVKELIVIGGLASNNKKAFFGVSNSHGKKLIKKLKLSPLDSEITVFGPMASALIYGEKLGLPVVCVLASASSSLPDPKAASRAINHLSSVLNFELDTKDLEKDAKKVEKRIKELDQTEDPLKDRMFV